jgi:carboxylate-amine ligase
LRVADACTRLDDALAIAALFRCLLHALERDRSINAGFDRVGRAITAENKWHAQRYGLGATFIDPIRRTAIAAKQWLSEVRALTAEDAKALECEDAIALLDRIIAEGTSADRQSAIYNKAKADGRQRLTALKDVVDWAAKETQTF